MTTYRMPPADAPLPMTTASGGLLRSLDWTDMPIHQAIKADWKTPEILIEGSLNCAKTTVFLDKEIDALLKYPGIPVLLFRWSQDAVDTKLRPAFEELLTIRRIEREWDNKKNRYEFSNGSVAYMFGLKAASLVEQFNKIRGLGVSRIGGDQVEEMSQAVAGELRGRLRPDLTATMNQRRFPFQLTFVSNPEDYDFWLSVEFPESNKVRGRKLYSLSIFDNKHLPQESVDSLLRQYPEDHPKHRTMILGRRGPNITGVPVYDGLYRKDLHWRPIPLDPTQSILEAFEFGKHTPVWIFGQLQRTGGLKILGGIQGLRLSLGSFLDVVKHYRTEWYPPQSTIKSCTAAWGEKSNASTQRYTGLDILRKQGVTFTWRDNGNAPDVRLAMIENIATYLRTRNAQGQECFSVNNEPAKFLIASIDGVRESPIVHHAFEGGYVWDAHYVSVSNKEVKQPKEDDKFANIMHAIENLELNFCAGQRTTAERESLEKKSREKALTQRQQSASSYGWMA